MPRAARLLPVPAWPPRPAAVATGRGIGTTSPPVAAPTLPHSAPGSAHDARTFVGIAPVARRPAPHPGGRGKQEGEAAPNAREAAVVARGHGASSTRMCCVRALEPWTAEPRDATCPRAAAVPSGASQGRTPG